jgi:hypothetical protein
MAKQFYRMRKSLLFPLGLDCLLLFCLLAMALLLKGESEEKLVFTLFFLPALVIFIECFHRQVHVEADGLRIRKLWRGKKVSWDEITHVGCLTIHKKVYLLLTTVKGFFIISSAYDRFPELAGEIVARVGEERVEQEVRLQTGRSMSMTATTVSAWVAAAALAGIMVMKLFPIIR